MPQRLEEPSAGGAVDDYKVSLKAGQFLHLVVDQRGIAADLFEYWVDDHCAAAAPVGQ